ncbi:MAG: DUF2059 domain-containing protein [Candidatus Omnitrophica bacterium]|nr:DUF2059 domain-containing protein [Candidatus Omnitrophota bacterium]
MKTLHILIVVMLLSGSAFAETIHLKNGRTVTGKILEKTDKNVKIESNGTAMTYYADEIQDIDGRAFAPTAVPVPPKPAQPVASLGGEVKGNKKELILKFIDVFGTREAMTQNLAAMLKSLPADNPEAQKIKDNINVDEIIERLIPVYDKQFSEEDLKSFIAFYSSPQGRKLVNGIPVIMRDSVEVSTQYFQEKFPETKQEINKE